MKVAYIAGAYRSSTIAGIEENIQHARKYAKKYWKLGFMAYCPHSNSSFMDGIAPDEVFLEGGLEMLRRCDIIVFIPGWEKSAGSRAEHDEAVRIGKEIIIDIYGAL